MLTFLQSFGGGQVATGVKLTSTESYRTEAPPRYLGEGTPLQTGTVISIWYQRTGELGDNQVIVGDSYTGIPSRGWAIMSMSNGIKFVSANQGSGTGNTGFSLSWSTPVDIRWHHILIRINTWSGAYPGQFSLTAYQDGYDLGTKIASGSGTYLHTNDFGDSIKMGYFDQVSLSLLSQNHFVGNVAQLWIGVVPTVNFSLRNYFAGGPVLISADGSVGGISPQVYDAIDWPFEGTSVMYNDITSTSRIPEFEDSDSGIPYDATALADFELLLNIPTDNSNTFTPVPAELGWGQLYNTPYCDQELVRDTYNTVEETYNSSVTHIERLKINRPGYYRVDLSGPVNSNSLTACKYRIQFRSNYNPGNTNSGDILWQSAELDAGNNSIDWGQVVYLEGYIQITYVVTVNYIEWRTSTGLSLQITTA